MGSAGGRKLARYRGWGHGRKDLPQELERIRRDNESLRRQIVKQQQELGEKERALNEKEKELAEQQRRIQDLERRLAAHNRNSTNSSKPPSSDGLAGPQRRRGRQPLQGRRRRKPGGQPGHRGHHRPLVPVEQVHELKTLLPQECQRCGEPLAEPAPEGVGEPRRHQVTEIPKVQAWITEYQRPQVKCSHCGQGNYAPLPASVRGEFGPQLTALIAYWTAVCRMPRRVVEAMLPRC